MDCPNCGVYNPQERETCWRCNTELPKKQPEKKRNPQQSARLWLYVAVAIFAAFTMLRMCGVGTPWDAPPEQGPASHSAPNAIVWTDTEHNTVQAMRILL